MRLLLLFILLAGLAYVRLAPSDPARWHQLPQRPTWQEAGTPWDAVFAQPGGAALRLRGDGRQLLADLAQVAAATPRTRLLAGSPEAGRMTWVTRSLLIGFPDYTTAEVREDGLYLVARQRFGNGDWGVNAARLQDWMARLPR